MYAVIKELDLFDVANLSFARPDTETFRLLAYAFDCAHKGGALPAVLNAANEVAVARFLENKIGFFDIIESVCETVDRMQSAKSVHSLEGIIDCDRQARAVISGLL